MELSLLRLPFRGRLIPRRTHHVSCQPHPSKTILFAKTLIRHFFRRDPRSRQSLTVAVGLLTQAMSTSAFGFVLVIAIRLIALSPAVLITTRFPTAYLSAVTLGAEIEDSATRAVLADTSTNNEEQGGEPFWNEAVDKGRRLCEALTLL
jgi:hypothetical protein